MTESRCLVWVLLLALASGCTSVNKHADRSAAQSAPEKATARASGNLTEFGQISPGLPSSDSPLSVTPRPSPPTSPRTPPTPLVIDTIRRTGTVANQMLHEISGLAASRNTPGVLFALNDSGNSPQLYALGETGADLGHWKVDARNRDWEDMGNLQIDGTNYLVLGDTGDNLQRRKDSTLYIVEEPTLDTPASTTLVPRWTLKFHYEDGPRNVEAFAFYGNTLFLITKEPVGPNGPSPSRLYELQIPEQPDSTLLIARHTGDLPPLGPSNLESRLAAALADVDLNHPTALDFDTSGNTAYLLTYRHVIRIVRKENSSWAEAFSNSIERIHSHGLRQAEALAVVPGQSVWLTSEHVNAPLWALPFLAPS